MTVLVAVTSSAALPETVATPPREADLFAAMTEAAASVRHATRSQPSAGSYRITVTLPRGESWVGIADGPRRYELIQNRGGKSSETYLVGPMVYQYFDGEGWFKIDMTQVRRLAAARGFKPRKSWVDEPAPAPVAHDLPDRRVNGVLMGAVRFTTRAWVPSDRHFNRRALVTMTCIYPKQGPEYESCSAGNLYRVTFDRYGDPANHFVVPKAALNAPLAPWLKE